ncbi:pseudaminic acid cytidylyltransferase [Caenimonas sedimenti]|uniref:Pseudaminic acid cytidylyltransferase n=1 Tax=Caenimonas sedimenti TaxID=2596921 RepID=A0A562ZK30_9BURK|nr:pseudaminic acid cytidylyltransferase [Caenimonas sedimenti]TWO68950.1 pseudaminic acid cytidylyltransferase [Caenimonas sedimenti]
MTLAIIPARGGSKRIPRKNIRHFAGRPMVAHSIAACLESGLFERVIVSTEDAEIAEVARSHGAEVPFLRPAGLADDHAGTDEVMAQVLGALAERGESPPQACCVYATAPLLRPDDLRAGRELLAQGWDYAFSAARYPHPVFRAFTWQPGQGCAMLMPQHYDTRSQDLPDAWHDAAQFYWGERAAWLERRPLFGARSAIVPLPRWRVQDIDTPEDWEMAELLYRIWQERRT